MILGQFLKELGGCSVTSRSDPHSFRSFGCLTWWLFWVRGWRTSKVTTTSKGVFWRWSWNIIYWKISGVYHYIIFTFYMYHILFCLQRNSSQESVKQFKVDGTHSSLNDVQVTFLMIPPFKTCGCMGIWLISNGLYILNYWPTKGKTYPIHCTC